MIFFFNVTATTEIYTLFLHDALPISGCPSRPSPRSSASWSRFGTSPSRYPEPRPRSEEHTSELQSHSDLVCRLLLEKKKGETCDYANPNELQTYLTQECHVPYIDVQH